MPIQAKEITQPKKMTSKNINPNTVENSAKVHFYFLHIYEIHIKYFDSLL